VDTPEAVGPAWDECLNAGRPALLEAITDPEVPPLPPHIRFEQAKMMAKALAKRDPAAREMITQSLKGKFAEFVNR
jgi:pyruvate dehydrogenase (quinone)